jgi:flavin reductase (DIM6/NTAB) family NADH-FMN oxidoreductase RutF
MEYAADDLTPRDRYKLLAGFVLPRPIAWVTTVGPTGVVNAAPFSFFNVFCEDPPLCMFAVSRRPDGRIKDTLINIQATGSNIITIGPVTGVHSIFGQVDDRTYIANIRNAAVDEGTAQLVYVDADGRLGTLPQAAGPERSVPRPTTPKGVRPQGMSDDAKQAMLNRKVEVLEATVAELRGQLKEQAAQIQKVSAQLEASKPAPQVVNNL